MDNVAQEKLIQEMQEMRLKHELKVSHCIRERLTLIQRADEDLRLRAAIIERASRDVKWFCNTWITTYNPRAKPHSLLPFVLFPEQEAMLDWIEDCYKNNQWGAVVKCRYTGASYITTMWMLHKIMFANDFTGTLASNKADSVDKTNSSKSLFYKIIDMYKRLPVWFKTFSMEKAKTRMLIYNNLRNSAIIGESGSEIGRGGRSSAALVDEAAFVEADDSMIAALSENTDCAIFVSTPNGVANQFFRLANASEVNVFYYRWQADPRRSVEWRLKQDNKLGSGIAKQELDCDFYADTGESFINPVWIESCIEAHLTIEGMEGHFDCQAGLDLAGSGANDSILAIRDGSIIQPLIKINQDNVTMVTLEADRILSNEIEPKPNVLCFDGDGIGSDVRGVILNMEHFPDYSLIEFRGGKAPSDRYWDTHDQISKDFLYNRRVEAWYILRYRIKCTYEHVNNIQTHPVENLISLPKDEKLRQDLVKPAMKYRGYKMLLMSKQEMIAKGLSSPDRGDAVAYACYTEGTAMFL